MKSLLILFTSIILWNNIVKAQPPCVNGHTNTDLSASLSAGLYYIDTDVYVTSDITITDAELLVIGNVTIYVQSGVTLTLNGVHIYGCDEMWQGIILDQNAAIVCNAGATHDNTLIEDADEAIALKPEYFSFNENYYYDWATVAGLTLIVDIKNTIFNRNRIGINFHKARFAYPTYPAIILPDYYPIKIYNTIFTCRDIPFIVGSNVWVDYEVFKNTTLTSSTTYPNTPASNSSPYINNSVYSPNNSHAYLKYPYNSTPTKSEIGIYAEAYENGLYKIGFEEDDINTNNVTLFDNHDYGIKMLVADVKIENCTFQNTPRVNTNPTTGIFAEDISEVGFWIDTRANAGKPHNAFFDCDRAIVSDFYVQVHIEDNDIRSSKTEPLAQVKHGLEGITVRINGFGFPSFGYGALGYNNTAKINTNELVNIAYPITLQFDYNPWTALAYGLPNHIDINDNWIALYRQSGSINDVLSGYLTEQAINCEAITFYPPDTLYPPIRCNRNQIQSARIGIRISGWDGKDVRVIDNNVLVNNNTLLGYNNAQGIVLQGNIPQRQYGNLVYKNVVSGHYNYPGYVNNINNTIRLIQMNNGLDYDVRCNQANGTARFNMTFSGIMPNVIFGSNIMSPDIVKGRNRALTLDNAIIGTQGTTANACGNNYDDDMNYAIFGTLKTFCINSDATQSRMYVYNTPGNFQNPDNFSGGGGLSYTPYAFANGSLQWANNQTTETCGTVENRSSTPVSSSVDAITNTSAAQFTDTIDKLQEMVNTATGSINIKGTDSTLRLYVAQLQLYRFLRNPNNVAAKSTQLQQFVAAKDTGSFGKMNQIAAALAKRDTALVQQLLNTWNKANRVDSNYAKFFTWTLQRGLRQPVNLAEVEALAQQCPQTDGNVVFLSQNLYNAITNKHRIFTTSCDLKSTEFPDNTTNYVTAPVEVNKAIK